MNVIDKVYEQELIINKSRFITILIPINDSSFVSNHILEIKNKYKNATHYCFAYSISLLDKAFDDGEPSGTAGLPILNIIKKNNLTNILIVVVRYFGGIKLGSGGLIRAYSKCANECLKSATTLPLINKVNVVISFDYDVESKINYLLSGVEIKKTFDSLITYEFMIDEEFDLTVFDNLVKTKRVY